jgi:hypothetical protein
MVELAVVVCKELAVLVPIPALPHHMHHRAFIPTVMVKLTLALQVEAAVGSVPTLGPLCLVHTVRLHHVGLQLIGRVGHMVTLGAPGPGVPLDTTATLMLVHLQLRLSDKLPLTQLALDLFRVLRFHVNGEESFHCEKFVTLGAVDRVSLLEMLFVLFATVDHNIAVATLFACLGGVINDHHRRFHVHLLHVSIFVNLRGELLPGIRGTRKHTRGHQGNNCCCAKRA